MFGDTTFLGTVMVPILICVARIADVTLGTIRIIYVSKGMKILASILGFFEILIWLFAIGQIMGNLTNLVNYFAYAVGFSVGVFVGIAIEEKLSLGILMLRIITRKDAAELADFLKSAGFGVTTVDANGIYGPVKVIFTIIQRKELLNITEIIKKFNPNAVYSVEDVRYVSRDPFSSNHLLKKDFLGLFRFFRKGK
ncbi:MAG: DUF2179 domain-containing protein [Deltaproteobacteria bacterium]|uniref:UPF0316 protein JW984_03580 n=1 Tax=Candidatus Zymogenus saltonus TaxID=2844893 RepID=A0A9D8KB44_9DELT|nr:DUF2179 domain-containing protein [Candidatus Zymogenus saltonus]